MDKKEFDTNFNLIKDIMSSSKRLNGEIKQTLKAVVDDVNEYISSMDKRDENLLNYVKILSEFDYSDKLTSPTDLFPGIKTASEMSDPEDLKRKADLMKDAAFSVKAACETNESMTSAVSQSIRTLFSLIREYDVKESQAYDLSMDLLSKSDSIYDIGGLVK